jgi:hypothetical protein
MHADVSTIGGIAEPDRKLHGFVGDIRLRVSNTRDVSSSVRRNIVAFAPPVLISPVLSIDVRFSAVSIFAIMASAIEAQ